MDVEVRGLSELGEALKNFPDVLGKKYLRKATFAAASVIKEDAITRAPEHTGALKTHIAVFRRPSEPSEAHYAIGVKGIKFNRKVKRVLRNLRKIAGVKRLNVAGDMYYWRMLEFGWHDKKGVFHIKSFMRPAFEAQKMNAIDKFRESLADGVQAAAAEVYR